VVISPITHIKTREQYELEQRLPSLDYVLTSTQGVVSIDIASKDNIDAITLRVLNEGSDVLRGWIFSS